MIKKLSHFYFYNLKLSRKLMLTYWLLLAIPTIIITGFLYGQIYDVVVSDTLNSEQVLAKQTAGTVEATLRQVTSTSNVIIEDSFLDGLFMFETDTQTHSSSRRAQMNSFIKSSVSATDNKELIQAIKIYVDEPLEYLCELSDTDLFEPLRENKGTYWHGIFNSSDIETLFCPSLYLSPSEVSAYGELAYIQKVYYEDAPGTTAAYVAVYFSQKPLDQILSQNISVSEESDSGAAYLLNERNATAATSNSTLSGMYFMNLETLKESIGEEDVFVKKTVVDEELYVTYHSIADTDWHLISFIPAAPLLEKGNTMIFQFIAFYAVFLLIAFVLAAFLSRSITNRIASVIRKMQDVRSGKLSPIEHHQEKDEIGDLVVTYNYMTDQINKLMKEQAEAADSLRNSEIKALQAQINPHFLYNTLDMINWLSQSNRSEDVTGAVQALSGFYKLTLSKSTTSRIEQELEHVKLYTLLQNMRFRNRITFLADVPEDLLDYEIPKLTFQPIIENAIQHGIMERESKEGDIVVTGWREEEDIIFLISDNGIGMTKEQLENVLNGSGNSKQGSNIGIYNTHRRLTLLYGPDYGLNYASAPGEGTEVTLRLPARLHEEHNEPKRRI